MSVACNSLSICRTRDGFSRKIQRMWRLSRWHQQCETLANVSLEIESTNVNKWPTPTPTQTPVLKLPRNAMFRGGGTGHAHFTYFQCKVHMGKDDSISNTWLKWKCRSLVRFRHQNHLVRFRKRFTWFGLGKDSQGKQSHVSGVKVLCVVTHPSTPTTCSCGLSHSLYYWQAKNNVVQARKIIPIEIHLFESRAGVMKKI